MNIDLRQGLVEVDAGLPTFASSGLEDLVVSLSGALVGAAVMATILWPAAGTPAALFGWSWPN